MPRNFGLRRHQFEPTTHPVTEWLIAFAAICAISVCAMLAFMIVAHAQDHHRRHHAHYQNWVNKADKGCCNDQDCGELTDDNERTSRGMREVRIEGEWCPVLAQHYLKTGNVPDASVAHVCVLKQAPVDPKPVCERLLCYQPKPGI